MTAGSFFYWGVMPLDQEVADDVRTGLAQPRRSLFYDREYGAGLSEYEGTAVSLLILIQLKYEAVKFMGLRNSVVTDGNGGPDRRAVTSQDKVYITNDGSHVDVTVEFSLMSDLSKAQSTSFPVGGGS